MYLVPNHKLSSFYIEKLVLGDVNSTYKCVYSAHKLNLNLLNKYHARFICNSLHHINYTVHRK